MKKIKELYNKARNRLNAGANFVWRRVQWYILRRPEHLWDKRLFDILKTVPKEKQNLYKTVLQNQHTHSMQQSRISEHDTKIDLVEITKLVLDQLVILDIVGVQPMQGPVGLTYKLQFVEEGEVEKTEEPKLGEPISSRRLSLQVVSSAVEAGTRKLETKWTIEAAADVSQMHEIDIEKELTQAIAAEIVGEITTEHLQNLNSLAKSNHIESDEPAKILLAINKAANEIGQKTRRGCGNFTVMSLMTWARLQDYVKSTPSLNFKPASNSLKFGRLLHVGTILGTMKLYTEIDNVTDNILVGYKGGSGEIDTGYFYNPYVMLMTTGVLIDPDSFQPLIRLMTRYGLHTPDNASDYYQQITFA